MESDTLIFPLVLAGVPILALAGIGCLFYCRGKDRRRLAWTAAVFLGALVLFFGGEILLGFFHLTWRNLPSLVLLGTLLVGGWVGVVLTVACVILMELPSVPAAVRWAAKAAVTFFAALVLLVTLWLGPLLFLFAFGDGERTVEYQGQTLVEVGDGFLDQHYSYYAYHGPLVRGTERLYDTYEPLVYN